MSTVPEANGIGRVELDEVIRRVDRLPLLPAVVTELLKASDNEEIDIQTLAHQVSLDQALAAKTLQLANSSFYGVQAKVTTIQQAVTLMGMRSVRALITSAAISNCLPHGVCAGYDFIAFWRHAVGTAICARILAMHLRLNLDLAYTAGLLHDIGRLMLVSQFPRHYEAVVAYRAAQDCQLLDAERAVLGIDHAIAGQMVAQHWNFSEHLQIAIAGHHTPIDLARHGLASVVHVADGIAHGLDLSGNPDDLVPPMSDEAWQCLSMSRETYLHVFRETELQFVQASRLLPT
jgi:putative nucleotidyltransferase with HDIG domain